THCFFFFSMNDLFLASKYTSSERIGLCCKTEKTGDFPDCFSGGTALQIYESNIFHLINTLPY
ncbi:hypothetical protein LJC54_10765, partial [Parabacteroides sp. OttesenSCG-928-J18]|nr:hypothetical protein [Parabacteroides sp. OttesenSCG-928-J18]